MQMESYDGTLRIVNVSREMSGMYRCQTSQYNGFNVKPREALVQLIVQCKYIFFYVFWDWGDKGRKWGDFWNWISKQYFYIIATQFKL